MVNPVVTGTEIKRISTPRFSTPSTNMMHPERKQSRTAISGLPFRCGLAIIDIIAVGPVKEDDGNNQISVTLKAATLTHSDVLARAKEYVNKATHECRVKSIDRWQSSYCAICDSLRHGC